MPLPSPQNTPRPRAHGFGARIGSLLVRLVVGPENPLTIQTAPLEPPRINTAESAEDIRNDFGALFSRSGFTGGEGLDFAHRTDLPANAAKRYWDSRHINVAPDRPGELESVTLLRSTENIEASAETHLHMAFDGSALYMSEGQTVRRSTDYTAATPNFADDDPHAGQGAVNVEDLTSLGEDIYAALGTSGIHKRDGGTGTWSELSTFNALYAWGTKTFLLASSGTILSDIDTGTGTATTLITLPDGEEWLDVADAGLAVLAAASDGYIYALGDDGTGGLELKGQSFIGSGLTPESIAARHGLVFYATAEDTGSEVLAKWWKAELTTDYVLDNSSLIRQFGVAGDGIDRTSRAMTSTNDAIYLGVNESTAAHVWRYDLATGGRARWWDSGVTGVPHDITFIAGEPFWTIEGQGMIRRHPTNLAADGYIIGPLGDLFTASAKAWVGALIDTEAVTAGVVELWYTTDPDGILDPDHPSWVRLRRVSSSTLPDTNETRIAGTEARFIAGMIRIYASGDLLTSPSVRGFTFRAYPGSAEVIVQLPVNTGDVIRRPGHKRIHVRGLGERIWEQLKGLEGSALDVELYSPDDLLRGVIEQVSTPVLAQPPRGSPTSVTLVRFRGRRISTEGVSESNGAMGVGTMGVMSMGGSEI